MRESLQGVFFGVCWEGKGSERALFSCLHGLQEHGKGAFLLFAGLARGRNGAFLGFARAASEEKGVFFAVARAASEEKGGFFVVSRCANLLRGSFFIVSRPANYLQGVFFTVCIVCKLSARVLFHSLHELQSPSEGAFFKRGGSCNSESRRKSDFSLFLSLQERVEILGLFFRMRVFYLRCL